jgi:hypothetical protein
MANRPPPGDMRASGVHDLLTYCTAYHCSHSTQINAEPWGDAVAVDVQRVRQAPGERAGSGVDLDDCNIQPRSEGATDPKSR